MIAVAINNSCDQIEAITVAIIGFKRLRYNGTQFYKL